MTLISVKGTNMDKLLKEAIADAKQIRSAALANARIALEESLQEDVSNVISAKLQKEFEDPAPADGYGKAEGGETDKKAVAEQKKLASSGIATGDNKEPAEAAKSSSDIENPGQEVKPMGEATDGAVANGDGHEKVLDQLKEDGEFGDEEKFGHEDGEDEFGDEDGDEDELHHHGHGEPDGDEGGEGGELDLEALIRELESELGIESAGSGVVGEDESELAARDNVVQTTENPMDAPAGDKTLVLKLGESEKAEKEDDEDEDLDEILRELTAEDAPMDHKVDKYAHVTELRTENANLKRRLKEHRDVVIFLKQRINEVNMLNAQLLFTNKIFKNYSLNLGQKKHVVEAFDRASTLREVKLVYSTLIETLSNTGVARVSKSGNKQSVKSITEGLASKTIGSTKPKTEIINESDAIVARLQKLAGIKKH